MLHCAALEQLGLKKLLQVRIAINKTHEWMHGMPVPVLIMISAVIAIPV